MNGGVSTQKSNTLFTDYHVYPEDRLPEKQIIKSNLRYSEERFHVLKKGRGRTLLGMYSLTDHESHELLELSYKQYKEIN